jgi:hypothetical protein
MRMLPIGAVGLSFLLLIAAGARADPPDAANASAGKSSWWWPPSWFASKSTAKIDAVPPTSRVDERAKITPMLESAQVVREREEKAWVRRQQVCDRLCGIAEQTGDEALRRRAEALAERAFSLYMQRTSGALRGTDLDGGTRLLDGARQGTGASLLPAGTTLSPSAGQANLRRDY